MKKIDVYSVVLDWKAPNGPNITNYTVEYSLDGTFWMKVFNLDCKCLFYKGCFSLIVTEAFVAY